MVGFVILFVPLSLSLSGLARRFHVTHVHVCNWVVVAPRSNAMRVILSSHTKSMILSLLMYHVQPQQTADDGSGADVPASSHSLQVDFSTTPVRVIKILCICASRSHTTDQCYCRLATPRKQPLENDISSPPNILSISAQPCAFPTQAARGMAPPSPTVAAVMCKAAAGTALRQYHRLHRLAMTCCVGHSPGNCNARRARGNGTARCCAAPSGTMIPSDPHSICWLMDTANEMRQLPAVAAHRLAGSAITAALPCIPCPAS